MMTSYFEKIIDLLALNFANQQKNKIAKNYFRELMKKKNFRENLITRIGKKSFFRENLISRMKGRFAKFAKISGRE